MVRTSVIVAVLVMLGILILFAPGESGRMRCAAHVKSFTHENGVLITVADSLFVEHTSAGFIVSSPGSGDFRHADEVVVELVPPGTSVYAGCDTLAPADAGEPAGGKGRTAAVCLRMSRTVPTAAGTIVVTQVDGNARAERPAFALLRRVIGGVAFDARQHACTETLAGGAAGTGVEAAPMLAGGMP